MRKKIAELRADIATKKGEIEALSASETVATATVSSS